MQVYTGGVFQTIWHYTESEKFDLNVQVKCKKKNINHFTNFCNQNSNNLNFQNGRKINDDGPNVIKIKIKKKNQKNKNLQKHYTSVSM